MDMLINPFSLVPPPSPGTFTLSPVAGDSIGLTSGAYAESGGTYSSAREGTGAKSTGPFLGYEEDVDPMYFFYRQVLISFDTSVIVGTVQSVTFRLWVNSSTVDANDFTLEARQNSHGSAPDASDWVPGSQLASKTLLATCPKSNLASTSLVSFTSQAAFATAINPSGATQFVVNIDLQRTQTTAFNTSRVHYIAVHNFEVNSQLEVVTI